jgi:hypothetical protein
VATVKDIADEIRGVGLRLEQTFKGNNWQTATPIVSTLGGYAPALSVDSIRAIAEAIANRVEKLSKAELSKGGLDNFLANLPQQLQANNLQNIQGDPDAVANGAVTMLVAIWSQLPAEALPPPKVDWEDLKDAKILPKDLANRLRSVEARLKDLEPRTESVGKKIDEIEAAHLAAEQLPTDMEDLAEKRASLGKALSDAQALGKKIGEVSDRATDFLVNIETAYEKANSLIKRSEQALRGSTGVGLAAAFEKRKANLTIGGWAWTAGLVLALGVALYIGADRVEALKGVLNSDRPASIVWVNALLAALGVGAPVWFAWLSTKQIWSNFRLAEDYAFKAAVSKAYEGYRAEAVDIDNNLRTRLFESALTRFEESPIRLLDHEAHGSPLQELLSNPVIRRQLAAIPNITDRIRELIPNSDAVRMTSRRMPTEDS